VFTPLIKQMVIQLSEFQKVVCPIPTPLFIWVIETLEEELERPLTAVELMSTFIDTYTTTRRGKDRRIHIYYARSRTAPVYIKALAPSLDLTKRKMLLNAELPLHLSYPLLSDSDATSLTPTYDA
jgi:hypothetical protein